jgi:uncharacterized protein YyaL (SSP411 family)
MTNRLESEISPYLLQHADNPVDWYPWGPEALKLAKTGQKPIFLSIGYSACHWCHVMAHESFENPEIAAVLNESFVPIKVDREERPELDQLYMEAVQMLSGRGGWPLSVFLTPSLEPFFGGTYWPPRARGGIPGFDQVLQAVADAWTNRRDEALAQADKLTRLLRADGLLGGSGDPSAELAEPLLQGAELALARAHDPHLGGFGPAPKFPHPMDLRLLLRRWRRTGKEDVLAMVTTTLDKMAAGGIYDHLGGGFHRYSTDERWLVPHFEKMLYDNALLAHAYLEAWQVTGNAEYARVVRETLDYVLRDMTDPGGAFYSTEDADSEGVEGKFYVWTPGQLRSVLGEEPAQTFAYVYDVTDAGNFEGQSILNRPKTIEQCAKILNRPPDGLEAELAESRRKLLEARADRVRPARDDKVLASWNGLLIDCMARAGAVLDEPGYLVAASSAADFLLENLRSADGRLLHCWRNGEARHHAFLEDHAALANGLVTLYETRFEEPRIDQAVELVDEILARFADRDEGGFYFTAADHEQLIARKKDLLDGAVPSGGSLATLALLRLGKLCGRGEYVAAAESALRASARLMERAPAGAGQMLMALDAYLGPTPEIAILGSENRAETGEVVRDLNRRFLPNKVVALREEGSSAGNGSPALSKIFQGKAPLPPGPTVFVCEDFACQSPVSGKDAALAKFAELEGGAQRK